MERNRMCPRNYRHIKHEVMKGVTQRRTMMVMWKLGNFSDAIRVLLLSPCVHKLETAET